MYTPVYVKLLFLNCAYRLIFIALRFFHIGYGSARQVDVAASWCELQRVSPCRIYRSRRDAYLHSQSVLLICTPWLGIIDVFTVLHCLLMHESAWYGQNSVALLDLIVNEIFTWYRGIIYVRTLRYQYPIPFRNARATKKGRLIAVFSQNWLPWQRPLRYRKKRPRSTICTLNALIRWKDCENWPSGFSEKSLKRYKKKKKMKEINTSKIYSPVGNVAERLNYNG